MKAVPPSVQLSFKTHLSTCSLLMVTSGSDNSRERSLRPLPHNNKHWSPSIPLLKHEYYILVRNTSSVFIFYISTTLETLWNGQKRPSFFVFAGFFLFYSNDSLLFFFILMIHYSYIPTSSKPGYWRSINHTFFYFFYSNDSFYFSTFLKVDAKNPCF